MRQLSPAVVIAIATFVPQLPQSSHESGASLAFTGAEVIDTTGGPAQPNIDITLTAEGRSD